jgi:HK97 family phage major capsid protein
MNVDLKKDYEALAKLTAEQKSLIETAEQDGNRSFTEDEDKKFDKLHNDAVSLERKIEGKKEILARENNINNIADEFATENNQSKEQTQEDAEKLSRAMIRVALLGENAVTAEEREILTRAQSTTNSEGGYTVPTDLAQEIIKQTDLYGGMRANSRILTTSSGNTLNFATNNDTAAGVALISEGNAITPDDDTVFGQKSLSSYKYGTAVYINHELIQDSDFDIVGYVTELFGERFGRGLNALYTTADGSSKPNGVMNASSAGVTLASQSAITYNEVLDLKHSVDPSYRRNGKFMFNDDTLLVLKKLAVGSSDARPLWNAGNVAGNVPATIDGTPYFINQDCDSLGSLKKVMAFGDFSKFLIRDAGSMRMIRDNSLRVAYDQSTLIGWWRTDSELLDTAAIKHMATLTNT